MMPDLDGWSVLAALRQDPQLAEIPVIMVTILDEQRRGMALGAAGYLTKPIDRERLRALVRRFARAGAARRACWWSRTTSCSASASAIWLEAEQWLVDEADNGRAALARLRRARPDVILLDLMMPEMDGFRARRRAAEAIQPGATSRSSSSRRSISTPRIARG